MFVSTPKGRNWFYNMYNMSGGGYESFTFSSYDNPLIDYKEIDDAKRNLPDHVFKQEYLAEFLEDGSSVFSNVKECVGVAETTSRLYAGVDLGRADDYTVLTILNDKGGMVYIKRWRHMDWLTIIKEVADVINEYNPITLVEANGVQDAIYESIREKCNIKQNITPFITTSKSKQTIIEDLIVSFEGLDVSILDEEYLVNELNMFTFEYNLKTRTIKYSAPTGQHDDTVMALAIAHHSLKSKRSVGTYSVR